MTLKVATTAIVLFGCLLVLMRSMKSLLNYSHAALEFNDYGNALEKLKFLSSSIESSIEQCTKSSCWKEAQQKCEAETDTLCSKSGQIWYPTCTGVNNEFSCIDRRTACGEVYGRGMGYPWQFGDFFDDRGMIYRCQRDNPQGCEKYGLIYYPKCRDGYTPLGCCICHISCLPTSIVRSKNTQKQENIFKETSCITENWTEYVTKSNLSCQAQAKQLATEIQNLLLTIDDNEYKIDAIKHASALLQSNKSFQNQCKDHKW